MFLNIITTMFVAVLLTSSSTISEAPVVASYIYIPSIVLKKFAAGGFEITEKNNSSETMGYLLYYQLYNPTPTYNIFNGTQQEHKA